MTSVPTIAPTKVEIGTARYNDATPCVAMRDTKQSQIIGDDAPVLLFTVDQWRIFLGAIKQGLLDHRNETLQLELENAWFKLFPRASVFVVTITGQAVALIYTDEELAAFIEGAKNGEFDIG